MTASLATMIQVYKKKVQDSGIPIQKMILFGSQAKGNTRPDSDIDVCVVSTAFGTDKHNERLQLMKLRRGITTLIEPHPYSPEDFDNPYDFLAQEIKRTGIVVS